MGNSAHENSVHHICALRSHGCCERRAARARLLASAGDRDHARSLRAAGGLGVLRLPARPDDGESADFVSCFMVPHGGGQRGVSLDSLQKDFRAELLRACLITRADAPCCRRPSSAPR